MINKTKLEAINSLVKELDEVKNIMLFHGVKNIELSFQDGSVCGIKEIDTALFSNALIQYRNYLADGLKQLGYEENYVEVTTREGLSESIL